MKWKKAKKKPVEVKFRKVEGERELIKTREGTLVAMRDRDFVVKGVEGEIYPIAKTIFYKTYDVIEK